MNKEKISIVIPNYNGAGYLRDCLRAVFAQRGVSPDVIVVDNGSVDDSVEIIRNEFPQVELITMNDNTGFCGGVNAGIEASLHEDYVILLNNDTVVEPDFTLKLYEAISGDAHIFSAQARMLAMADHSLIDDAGDFYCALGWAFARGKGKMDGPSYREKKAIFSACAGAAIYRVSILKAIGLFDENHFAYLEDLDIGWRARIQGYKNIYAPEAVVYHIGSASSGSVYNLFKVKNSSRNSIYVIGKNMPLFQWILNLPFFIPGFLVKALFFAVKGFGKEYLVGIGKGLAMIQKGRREGKVVTFKLSNIGNYIQIQFELWINILRKIKEFF